MLNVFAETREVKCCEMKVEQKMIIYCWSVHLFFLVLRPAEMATQNKAAHFCRCLIRFYIILRDTNMLSQCKTTSVLLVIVVYSIGISTQCHCHKKQFLIVIASIIHQRRKNCSESDSNEIVSLCHYRYSCSVAFSILIESEQLLQLYSYHYHHLWCDRAF